MGLMERPTLFSTFAGRFSTCKKLRATADGVETTMLLRTGDGCVARQTVMNPHATQLSLLVIMRLYEGALHTQGPGAPCFLLLQRWRCFWQGQMHAFGR